MLLTRRPASPDLRTYLGGRDRPHAASPTHSITPGGLVLCLHPTLADTDFSLLGPDWPGASPLASGQLATITEQVADAADRWRPIVRHDPHRRWYTRLANTDTVEVWLLGWTSGQQVPAHDLLSQSME
jgi:hypothetical protein